MARMASSAWPSVSAATAAISKPAYWISVPGPLTILTALTPGIFSAAEVSMLTTLAWAYGERSILPKSIPGRLMSKVYFAFPETLSGPSRRLMRLPMCVRLPSSGHLYSAIALASFPQRPAGAGNLRDGAFDAIVGTAAAEIAADSQFDLFRRRLRMFVEQRSAGHHKAWCAEPALLCIVIPERLLDGMQLPVLFEAFDGLDLVSLRFDGQNGAGIDRFTIHNDRTGAAGGAIADALGPGNIQVISKRVEQRHTRFDFRGFVCAVDREGDVDFVRA